MVDAPHDLDLERALLAAIIRDNAVLDQLGSFSGDQFFDAMHGAAFDTMLDLRRGGRAINAVTLRELTGSDPLGGTSLLDNLKAVTFADDAASPHDVAFELVILATRRAMIGRGDWLAEQAKGSHAKPADILAIHLSEIDTLIAKARPQGKTMWDWPDAMSAAQDVFQADKSADHIPTGLTDLDKATGGWARKDLAILAGRPSMGKSALAVCFGTNAARAGHGVLIFSLEMSMPAWMARVSSEATWSGEGSGIPYAHVLRHQLKGKELEAFMRAGNHRALLPCKIEAQGNLSAAEIAARTRKAASDFERQGKRLGLVIVDHLGKVQPTKNYRGNRVMEIGEITNSMANLAKAEDVAVLGLHQLNRAVEGRDNKRPQLADLRDSGNVEQDADMVLFAYRAAYYLERAKEDDGANEAVRKDELEATRHALELAIAKQRNGETTSIDLFCDMSCNVIRNAVKEAA